MNFVFDEESLRWLKQKGFNNWEIEDAQKCISIALKNAMSSEATIKLPEKTTMKVAALAYAVLANLEEREANDRYLTVSEEMQRAFNEEIELGELERIQAKMSKIKLGRLYSDARRKSSVKKGNITID